MGARSAADWGRCREGDELDSGAHQRSPRGGQKLRARMAGLEQRGTLAGENSREPMVPHW